MKGIWDVLKNDKFTIMVASVLAALISSWFTLRINQGSNQLSREDTFIDQLVQDNNRLRTMEEGCDVLKERVTQLEHQVELLNTGTNLSPLPQWIKDKEGVVLWVNDAFERVFLNPRGYEKSDYIGNMEESVWPSDLAAQFRANDAKVMATGQVWNGFEYAVDVDGSKRLWRVAKYVRYATVDGSGRGVLPIGVAGIALPVVEKEVFLERNFQEP